MDTACTCCDRVLGWAKGSPVSPVAKWLLYILCGALTGCGIGLVAASALASAGATGPLDSPRLEAWWSAAGIPFGPLLSFGLLFTVVGGMGMLSANNRAILNLWLLLLLLLTIGCALSELVARELGYGYFTEDIVRGWSALDDAEACNLEHKLHCSGITDLCGNTTEGGSVLVGWVRKQVTERQCPVCPDLDVDNHTVPCIIPIRHDFATIISPIALGLTSIFLVLSLIAMLSAKPLGLTLACTSALLIGLAIGFSTWRQLYQPSAEEIVWKQRLVAGIMNTIALNLAIFSIASLHWQEEMALEARRSVVWILIMVPVFALTSNLALLFPRHEEFFNLVREVYSTYLLWQLVLVWDNTADVYPLVTGDNGRSRDMANRVREQRRCRIKYGVAVKIFLVDLNGFLFAALYPAWFQTLLVVTGLVLFSYILVKVHSLFELLVEIHATGELQFFSVKGIVSFVFFDFAVLKVFNIEGLETVMIGEMYVSAALVGLAAFQLHIWACTPLKKPLRGPASEETFIRPARSYGSTGISPAVVRSI